MKFCQKHYGAIQSGVSKNVILVSFPELLNYGYILMNDKV